MMTLHRLVADGREVVIREPTWGDQKAWDAAGMSIVMERAVALVRSVDGVPGADGLSIRASMIVGSYADKLCVFGPEEGEAVLASLTETMDGISRVWRFTARDRTFTVREPTPAIFVLCMKQNGVGKPAFNALAERCLVEVDGRPPPPGAAAAVGIPLPVMNYVGHLIHEATFITEAEVDASHKGAALVESP